MRAFRILAVALVPLLAFGAPAPAAAHAEHPPRIRLLTDTGPEPLDRIYTVTLTSTAEDTAGQPVAGATAVLQLDMAFLPHSLGTIPLAPTETPGVYRATVSYPHGGDWRVIVWVKAPVEAFAEARQVIMDDGRTLNPDGTPVPGTTPPTESGGASGGGESAPPPPAATSPPSQGAELVVTPQRPAAGRLGWRDLANIAALWLHTLAAVIWVGGMGFLTFVLYPALGRTDRLAFVHDAYRRYSRVAMVCVALLVGLGVYNAQFNVPIPTRLLSRAGLAMYLADWYGTAYVVAFGVKQALVVAMLVFSALSHRIVWWVDFAAHWPRLRTYVTINLVLGALVLGVTAFMGYVHLLHHAGFKG